MKISPHVRRASQYASKQHKGQFRGDGKTPYIVHPLGVAKILRDANIHDGDVILAAILHDTIEDTGSTKKELSEMFGSDVANLVHEVTNNPDLNYQDSKLAQISAGRTRSLLANQLKVADKTYNLRDLILHPPNWSREKKIAYINHAKAVINAIPFIPEKLYSLFNDAYLDALERMKRVA